MRNIFKLLVLTFAVDAYALSASGLCKKAAFPEIKQLANYFGEQDPRMSPAEFAKRSNLSAKEVAKQFSGSGKVVCDLEDRIATFSAQLVADNKTIVTSAHSFYEDDCSPRAIKKCQFYPVFSKGKSETIDLSRKIVKPCSNDGFIDAENDWAVLELNRPIDGVTPFNVPKSSRNARKGDNYVQVAGHSSSFKGANFSNCTVVGVDIRFKGVATRSPIATDCPADTGSSGSGQFMPRSDGTWEIHAIVSWTNENAKDGDAVDIRQGLFNTSTPITGELWEELNRRANESN